jgi:hypothetical protein
VADAKLRNFGWISNFGADRRSAPKLDIAPKLS